MKLPKPLNLSSNEINSGVAWVAQSVEYLTSAQVMTSWFVGLSPTSGSLMLMESPLQILCPPLNLPLSCSCSLSKINIKKSIFKDHGINGCVGFFFLPHLCIAKHTACHTANSCIFVKRKEKRKGGRKGRKL